MVLSKVNVKILIIHKSGKVLTGQDWVNSVVIKQFEQAKRIDLKQSSSIWLLKFVYITVGVVKAIAYIVSRRPTLTYISHSRSLLGVISELPIFIVAWWCKSKVTLHWHGAELIAEQRAPPIHILILVKITSSSNFLHIVLGSQMRRRLIQLGVRRTTMLNNPAKISCAGFQRRLYNNRAVRLVFCSNLMPQKGVLDAIEVTRKCVGAGLDVRLDIIGAGNARELASLRREISELDEVFYHGALYGTDRDRVMSNADIFLFPSTYPTEAQPLAVIEAMMHGLPVLAYDHNMITSLVGDAGVTVTSNDVVALYKSALAMISSPPTYANASKAGISQTRRYQEQAFIAALKSILQSEQTA